MTNLDNFDEKLLNITNTTRQANYGHPLDHFTIAANIKAQLQTCPNPVMKHILEVMADKMARLCHSPGHFDSWLDIAGYSRTAMMVMDRQEEENPYNIKYRG